MAALPDAFAARSGAVLDDGMISHYGDPMREQRRLAAGSAVALLGDRTVIEVAGDDRLTWLDSITSQDLTTLTAGQSTELL
ncbi:MAG: folate-binding protein, partial [Microbacterium sp.]